MAGSQEDETTAIEQPVVIEASSSQHQHLQSFDLDNGDEFELIVVTSSSSNDVATVSILSTIITTTSTASSTSGTSHAIAGSNGGNIVRTIKLPETHIFTPGKCSNPVSRDSTDRIEGYRGGEFCGGDKFREASKLDKTIALREYHDLEYSLEKNTGNRTSPEIHADGDDFNVFQASESAGQTEQTEEQWSEQNMTHLQLRSEFKFESEQKEKVNDFSGKSEESEQLEEEFSDFQAAVPVVDSVQHIVNKPLMAVENEQNRSNASSPMLLSPAILLPQQARSTKTVKNSEMGHINWPDPGINADELARFEAAFSTPKVISTISSNHSTPKHFQVNSTIPSTVDDDEWTDFVYSKPAIDKSLEVNHIKTTNSSSIAGNQQQQEEWTDFIYSTPSSQSFSSSQTNLSFMQQSVGSKAGVSSRLDVSGPKFSSWNLPQQLPSPQFSSWNSNNFYYTSTGADSLRSVSQTQTYEAPTLSSTNDRGHDLSSVPVGANSINSRYYNYDYHNTANSNTARPTYLPELSFITPTTSTVGKNTNSGAKPLPHSFLSNVISSSSFAKK